jgi:predicted nucleic acid-binding protein
LSVSVLIDSDVLVWLTRGHLGAAQRLNVLDPWVISVVTYIELAQGCRDKKELARLRQGLSARRTHIVQITPAISTRAAELVDALALSHGMRLADALIAATAVEQGTVLLTANLKHFGAVGELRIEPFVP